MADDNSQDKTEEPTERKLEKARDEGQLVRSRELQTTVLLLAGIGAVWVGSAAIWERWTDIGVASFALERAALADPRSMITHVSAAFGHIGVVVVPVIAAAMLAAILGTPLVGGMTLASKALMPKGSRIDPIAGFKRMFSMRSLVELLKSVAKFLLVAVVSVMVLIASAPDLLHLDVADPATATQSAAWIVGLGFLLLAMSTLLIALIDVPFQMHQHSQQLRMTRQEVKDEFKQSEGSPEVKARVRRLQQQLANARMMDALPEADVVITNPDHYAVALRYDVGRDAAPVVLARGVDRMALRIRDAAAELGVPQMQAPPLARAVYFSTRIGDTIPTGLYRAVAQVLAYVRALQRYRRVGGERPRAPKNYDIPESLRR